MKCCAAPNCRYPVWGKGYCKSHQYMRSDFDRRSPLQKHFDNVASGKAVKAAVPENGKIELNATNYAPAALDKWFDDRRKEMKGRCSNCGGQTLKPEPEDVKFNNKYYKHFAAHILPKAYFPSVALHPSNCIELCFFGNSCHSQMDNHVIDLIDMNCWDEIVEKFLIMYPHIAKEEKRRIPKVLLNYVNIDV